MEYDAVIHGVQQMQELSAELRQQGKRIGLVATMGALHEGHLSLLDVARERADVVVVSIFVNPTQFGPNEDFSVYPRQLEADVALCRERGADVIFVPEHQAIFPEGFSTFVKEEAVASGLCGVSRPGHFRGVTTVVTILFNIVQPHIAVFGQKDAQQCAVIYKMIKDLAVPIEMVLAPTVRESNGLAMSSRNQYLDQDQRREAAKIYRALQEAKSMAGSPGYSIERLRAGIMNQLTRGPKLRVIYVEIVNRYTMEPVKTIAHGETLAMVAVWLDEVRLIDNVVL